jgi:hypothetical protein
VTAVVYIGLRVQLEDGRTGYVVSYDYGGVTVDVLATDTTAREKCTVRQDSLRHAPERDE